MLFSTNENNYPPTHHGKIIWRLCLKKYYKRESNGLIWILSIEVELEVVRYMNATEINTIVLLRENGSLMASQWTLFH